LSLDEVLGRQRYSVGRAWAGKSVSIRFLPDQRACVFTDLVTQPETTVTRPAKGLSAAKIIGPIQDPVSTRPLQLPLLLRFSDPQEQGAA
jgi:hypothetical protein